MSVGINQVGFVDGQAFAAELVVLQSETFVAFTVVGLAADLADLRAGVPMRAGML